MMHGQKDIKLCYATYSLLSAPYMFRAVFPPIIRSL